MEIIFGIFKEILLIINKQRLIEKKTPDNLQVPMMFIIFKTKDSTFPIYRY